MAFLIPGFWYLEGKNNQEKYFKKKNIFTTKIYSYKKNIKNWTLVEKLYKKILIELAHNLNSIHKLAWKASSWEIIVGPWLKKYIVVVVNRILIIKTNYNLNKKFSFANKNKFNLNSYDINDFIFKVINNSWNEEIFKRLERYFYLKKKITDFDYKEKERNKVNLKKNNFSLKNSIIYFILKIYNSILARKSNFVFSRPYFGKKSLFLKFLLGLKEFPIIYYLDNEKMNLKIDKGLRKKLNFKKSPNVYENISKTLIAECLPKIYLEGFDEVRKKINKSNLPLKKKIIFTSNLRNDSIFKFWLAHQKELGAKIILAQHGGGYNMFKFDESQKYELKICDKYLSWGWKKKNNKKVIPFSILNQNIKPLKDFNKKNGIAIAMNNFDQYIYANDPPTILNLIDSDKNLDYRELFNLKIFLNGLKHKVKNEIVIRPHPSKLRKHTTSKFEKEFEGIFEFDRNYKISGEKFLEKFKLNIFMQLQSTTTIFSMAKNFPTIIVCPHELKYFNRETQKLIISLKKANIYHTCPKKAFKFLNKIHDNPKIWWNKKETQDAKNMFCEKHGRISSVSNISELIKVLLKEKNNFIRN